MTDPDEYSLDVLTSLLNSFGGRLFNTIRSREGLAYSVSGGWVSTPLDHPGLFLATAETAQPGALLRALRAALEGATAEGPTPEELARAREESANSFVFNFVSKGAQLQRAAVFDLLGLPQDYLFRYKAGVEEVTAEGVLAAARRRLHPAQQTVVVMGDAAKLRGQLLELGLPLEELELR